MTIEGTLTGFSRHDTWCGWMPVYVEAFRTKRRGVPVTRYRLKTMTWTHHMSHPSEAHALATARLMGKGRVDWRATVDVPGA